MTHQVEQHPPTPPGVRESQPPRPAPDGGVSPSAAPTPGVSPSTAPSPPQGSSLPSPPLPILGISTLFMGAGLLAALWLYRHEIQVWPDSVQLLAITAASFLLLWGFTELISGLIFRVGRGHITGATPPRLDITSWLGILLLSLGSGSLFFVPWQSQLGFLPIAAIVIGFGFLVHGAKQFVDRLIDRQTSRPVEGQAVAITAAGATCLLMAMVFLLGAFIGPSNMLMLMFASIAGPFIMNGWYAFRMIRGLRIERALPTQVLAGEPLTVTVTLFNRKSRMSTWLMTVTDQIVLVSGRNAGRKLEAHTIFQRVPPREQRDASYRLRLMQRGRYVFGSIRVRSRFPLGLVERSRFFPVPAELIVAPRLGRLTDRWYNETMSADELVMHQRPRRGVFPDEFEKLRGFRYGDNPRMIHWRTSARQNSLMVREYQEIRDRDLLVLVDLTNADNTEANALLVELAVSFAATLCVEQAKRSRQSRLALAVAGRDFVQWTGAAHPSSADVLLRMLALVEASPDPPQEELWRFARDQRTATTAAICLTSRATDEDIRPAGFGWIRMMHVGESHLADYFQLD